jgi:hypothetical protein
MVAVEKIVLLVMVAVEIYSVMKRVAVRIVMVTVT